MKEYIQKTIIRTANKQKKRKEPYFTRHQSTYCHVCSKEKQKEINEYLNKYKYELV